jgi:hypothetical protein
MRVARKVETIREDLGKVGPVIAQQVEEAMLGRRGALNTAQAEKEAEPVRRMLKFERDLSRQVKALMEQYRETQKDLRLSPDNIEKVVRVALDLAGQPPLALVQTPDGRAVFQLPALRGSWYFWRPLPRPSVPEFGRRRPWHQPVASSPKGRPPRARRGHAGRTAGQHTPFNNDRPRRPFPSACLHPLCASALSRRPTTNKSASHAVNHGKQAISAASTCWVGTQQAPNTSTRIGRTRP